MLPTNKTATPTLDEKTQAPVNVAWIPGGDDKMIHVTGPTRIRDLFEMAGAPSEAYVNKRVTLNAKLATLDDFAGPGDKVVAETTGFVGNR